MWSKKFWADAVERAVKSGAQVAILAFGGLQAIDEMDWADFGYAVAGAIVLSLLTSIVSSRVGSPTDASVVK